MKNNDVTIVHISDPHFGTEDEKITNALVSDINGVNPDLIVISGDLTQRALKNQFLKAKELIEKINSTSIVIPGNHDIPLYNLFQRFTDPFGRFKKYITHEEFPEYSSNTISIIGVNTSTPFRSQRGRIKTEDIDYLKNYFSDKSSEIIKGVVVHHNAFPFEGLKGNSALENTNEFLSEMNKCGVDLIFAGHLHKSIVHTFNEAGVDNNLVMLQAGTCISRRLRKEENTYLIVKTKKEEINIDFKVYNGSEFEVTNSKNVKRIVSSTC